MSFILFPNWLASVIYNIYKKFTNKSNYNKIKNELEKQYNKTTSYKALTIVITKIRKIIAEFFTIKNTTNIIGGLDPNNKQKICYY